MEPSNFNFGINRRLVHLSDGVVDLCLEVFVELGGLDKAIPEAGFFPG